MSSRTGPAAREDVQGHLRRQEKTAAKQLEKDLRAVLETPAGRRLVWHLIDQVAGTFGSSYAGADAATAYNEGRRSVGIELMQACQRTASPLYVTMLGEQIHARAEADRVRQGIESTETNE